MQNNQTNLQGYTDIPVDLIEKDELEVKVYIESLSGC
jgi:hypothetical protein